MSCSAPTSPAKKARVDADADEPKTVLIAFDIETTGPDPYLNHLLEVGATAWTVGEEKRDHQMGLFLGIPPDGPVWCPDTVATYWDSPEQASKNPDGSPDKTQRQLLHERTVDRRVQSEQETAAEIVLWCRGLKKLYPLGTEFIIILDTGVFDALFLSSLLSRGTRGTPHYVPNLSKVFGYYSPVHNSDSFAHGVGGRLQHWGAQDSALRALFGPTFKAPAYFENIVATHDPRRDSEHIVAWCAFIAHEVRKKGTYDLALKECATKKQSPNETDVDSAVDNVAE